MPKRYSVLNRIHEGALKLLLNVGFDVVNNTCMWIQFKIFSLRYQHGRGDVFVQLGTAAEGSVTGTLLLVQGISDHSTVLPVCHLDCA